MIHPTAKVSERTNRNFVARNTLVQLLALYTDPESHNAQHNDISGADHMHALKMSVVMSWRVQRRCSVG